MILYCVTNHERLLRDLDIWQRTSRAVLSLHTDRKDVLQVSQALKQKRDRTQISQRVLVEMAICTCPFANGRPATQADLDYLGAQVALLIATAAHSDAIRAGWPRLQPARNRAAARSAATARSAGLSPLTMTPRSALPRESGPNQVHNAGGGHIGQCEHSSAGQSSDQSERVPSPAQSWGQS